MNEKIYKFGNAVVYICDDAVVEHGGPEYLRICQNIEQIAHNNGIELAFSEQTCYNHDTDIIIKSPERRKIEKTKKHNKAASGENDPTP